VNNVILNEIYRDASGGSQKGHLVYSEEQNVPADVVGMRAAVVIEAAETHTRTGFVDFDLGHVPGIDPKLLSGLSDTLVRVPVTHGKVFGWYDNEYGSYTNMLGDLTVHVHRTLD
jgi:glyceraldehyde 3-phosphate dehydrogenase